MTTEVIKVKEQKLPFRVRATMAYQFIEYFMRTNYTTLELRYAFKYTQVYLANYVNNDISRLDVEPFKEVTEPIPSGVKNLIYSILNGRAVFFLYTDWTIVFERYYAHTFIDTMGLKEKVYYLVDDLE